MKPMDAREHILSRVRSRLGRSDTNAAPARQTIAAALASRDVGPRPSVTGDLTERFVQRSLALSSTVERVQGPAEVADAVASYLQEHGLPAVAVCAADVADLDWGGAGVLVEVREARDHDLVGITACFCAIAETGTLMLCSSPTSPAAVSLLPETHIAVVRASRILPSMEEAWHLARAELGTLPRAVNFVSGPSRTGDIEQTIVLGAHGPYRVHIVVVAGA